MQIKFLQKFLFQGKETLPNLGLHTWSLSKIPGISYIFYSLSSILVYLFLLFPFIMGEDVEDLLTRTIAYVP
jgi:hypothetical protein